MQLLDSKALLAKLMATENLTIEQKKVPTAAFDVKNRVLVVPTLDKNISGQLYDLFMGHEVGHALYTPLEGVEKAIGDKINRSVLNVVEDVRIERKIKNKYPGLRNSFVKGYAELHARDFFNISNRDLNKCNLADKINLHSKIGSVLGIKFDATERELLDEVNRAETHDDAIEVTKKIVAYMKEQKKMQQQEQEASLAELDDEENESGDNYADFDEWEESDSESEDGQTSSEQFGDEEVDGEDLEKSYGLPEGGFGTHDEDYDIRSYTDDAYKQNESKLFDTEGTEYLYLNIPKINLDKAIFDYKALWNKYKETHAQCVSTERFAQIRKETSKVTSYLAKEFEMRKNAEQMKRASTAKTGELNMDKIYSYQFNDDIFKKITVMPGGKSHGLVLFLDWSGSMNNHIDNTIKQLISLVMFCKKVNIPYEVYAFQACDDNPYRNEFKENDLVINEFKLLNFLSSRMSAAEFNFAASALIWMGHARGYRPYWLQMGGTPLNEAIITGMELIPYFQKKYKLQIVNTVFLTDGEGHTLRQYFSNNENGNYINSFNRYTAQGKLRVVLVDPVTKNQEMVDELYTSIPQTSAFVKLLKRRTGCNVLGFYVLSGRDFNRESYKHFRNVGTMEMNELRIKFRKEKSMVLTNSGFDEYYLLRSEGLDTEEEAEFTVKENATTRGLVSAFSKYAGNKVASRVVLNRFIGMIS